MKLLILIASMACLTLAAPSGWSPDAAKFYSEVSKTIDKARRDNPHVPPSCDLAQAVLPTTSQPLPAIPEGQKLLHVAVGRGVQNYTCASSTTDKPKAIGAVATLFNASCIATTYPYLLTLLPNIALQSSNPPLSPTQNLGPNDMTVLGYHFFSDGTTAVFDLGEDGFADVKKIDAVDAPETALKGVGDQMTGTVAWLFLQAIPGSKGKAKSVYRVNTAGGKPPKTCEGQEEGAVISVQYAAEYWFYG
ncbi:hypothetical protein FQN55_009610 [Onygenales sp. PD_40]|nr:hypothetical protein FQN55_009610 [Onygenales sp. PD_40]KAK2792899.1 hypothetical protein FQN52_002577 [Onygenales sp. PD_12]KAK2805871.1 hypothetical protein FQN51_008645 [Onygenales sp. PD_10]